MTTFLLVRHGSIDALGKRIVGRSPGVHLNANGKKEASQLAEALAPCDLAAIYSSPLERAQQTASQIACKKGMALTVDAGLHEIDYGEWTGKTFAEVRNVPEWTSYNLQRDAAQIPGGENMMQLSRRLAATLARLRAAHTGHLLCLVTHADWIRAAGAHVSGASLDIFQRLQVDPASVSVVQVDENATKIVRWNVAADARRSLQPC